jgi:hypothetical protein
MPQKQAAQLTGHRRDNVEILAGQYLGGSVLQPIRGLSTMAFGARSIAAAVVNPEGFMTVIAVVALTAHGLRHARGDILQCPVMRREHKRAKLFLIGTDEAAYDISEFELWLTHGRLHP